MSLLPVDNISHKTYCNIFDTVAILKIFFLKKNGLNHLTVVYANFYLMSLKNINKNNVNLKNEEKGIKTKQISYLITSF